MTKLANTIDFWIFRAYEKPSAGLPVFRVFYALFLLGFYFPKNTNVWSLPPSFYEPPLSLAVFFSTFPAHWFFQVLDYMFVLGAFCLLFGCYTRFFSLFLASLIVLNNSFQYSVGKVGHEILIPALLFCLAWSNWGSRYSADERRLPETRGARPVAWPMALLMFIVGLCMLTASISKAKSGWLDPHLQCCRGQLILNYVSLGRSKWLADVMLSVQSAAFWKFHDVSTVVLEGSFIVAMFWVPAMRFVAASACIFHAFVYFSMDILFIANPAAYACLVDFRCLLRYRWVRRLFRRFARFARHVRLLPLTLCVTPLYAFHIFFQSPEPHRGSLDLPPGLVAGALLLFGLWGVSFIILQTMDAWLWNVQFPVRRGRFIVLYDGNCGLCDRWVQFVLKHDKRGSIQFAPLQSQLGHKLSGYDLSEPVPLSSMILYVDGRTYFRSDAVAMIFRQLGFPWSFLGVMGLIPSFIRDRVYDFVAAHRNTWFRGSDSCRLLFGEGHERFLS